MQLKNCNELFWNRMISIATIRSSGSLFVSLPEFVFICSLLLRLMQLIVKIYIKPTRWLYTKTSLLHWCSLSNKSSSIKLSPSFVYHSNNEKQHSIALNLSLMNFNWLAYFVDVNKKNSPQSLFKLFSISIKNTKGLHIVPEKEKKTRLRYWIHHPPLDPFHSRVRKTQTITIYCGAKGEGNAIQFSTEMERAKRKVSQPFKQRPCPVKRAARRICVTADGCSWGNAGKSNNSTSSGLQF